MESSFNIYEASQMLHPLLASQEPPFEETLNWIQFACTPERKGAYEAPTSMVLDHSAVSEGDTLFPAIWRHLLRSYPGTYAPTTSTLGPLGLEY